MVGGAGIESKASSLKLAFIPRSIVEVGSNLFPAVISQIYC